MEYQSKLNMLLPAIQLLTSLTITTLILATLMISLEYCNNLSHLLNDLISSSLTFSPTNMEYNQVIGCKTYYSLAFICLFLSFLLPLFSFYSFTLLTLATLTFLLFLNYSKSFLAQSLHVIFPLPRSILPQTLYDLKIHVIQISVGMSHP